jgi:hypothetical protein
MYLLVISKHYYKHILHGVGILTVILKANYFRNRFVYHSNINEMFIFMYLITSPFFLLLQNNNTERTHVPSDWSVSTTA